MVQTSSGRRTSTRLCDPSTSLLSICRTMCKFLLIYVCISTPVVVISSILLLPAITPLPAAQAQAQAQLSQLSQLNLPIQPLLPATSTYLSYLYKTVNQLKSHFNNLFSLSFLFVSAQPNQPQPQQQQQSGEPSDSAPNTYQYGLAGHGLDSSETLYHSKSLIVNIPSLGKVQGKRDHGIDFYGGIPYAAPPVGQLRFAPPEPTPPWAPVVLDGTHYGADCWQLEDPVLNPAALRDYMSEDCLSLNVFTPAGHAKKATQGGILFDTAKKQQDKLLPVLVWLHGGAFQQGGARRPEYDGRRLAERDVLVVTLNYRLGALGFLVSSADGVYGNFGLMDQRAALHFIHDNIAHFGGDPNRITLFGESAGAAMTGQHLMMEGAGTLFQSAIMQSNPLGYIFRPVVIADFIGEALKRSVDCRDLDCLRAERVEEIMRAQSTLMGVPRSVGDFFTWGPTVTQERHVNVGGGGRSRSTTTTTSKSFLSSSSSTSEIYNQDKYRPSTQGLPQDGLLLDWEDYKHHRRRRGNRERVRDAYAVNVTQPLKSTHLIPDHIPIIIGSNQHEGEMFIHSAFPITMSKPVYWMFVGALFRDSASRVLKHYRGYVEQIEAEANELAKKQVEEEENKLYYLEHKEELQQEYELLLRVNSSSRTGRVLMGDDSGDLTTVIKTWGTGGAQEPWISSEDEEPPKGNSASDKAKKIIKNIPWRRWPQHKHLKIDYNHSRKPPFHLVRKFINQTMERIPMLRELDPEVATEKEAERELKRKAKAKEKALKEAAKVVVDYRPVMSRIIDDYLFRCPSWHYAHKVSRNRVQNSESNATSGGAFGYEDDESNYGRSKRTPKHKYKRSRHNNNIYVYRFSQPTHIPGYKECWGKSCHTAELPYVFQAMDIIRSHYSTLGPFAQREAPVSPEYPYTDILQAYQGALEDVEDDHYNDDDVMWKDQESAEGTGNENPGRGGGDQIINTNMEDMEEASPTAKSFLSNHTSTPRSHGQHQHGSNMTGSKAFQRLLKNVFGDYFADDADEEIAADIAERWVSFAKFGDPNYDSSKANWLPWRYLKDEDANSDEHSEIPWEPQEFEYMDDELEDEDEEESVKGTGFQWSEDRAERIYRKRALKALGMEVIDEDQHRTELRRMPAQSGLNEMEAVFTFLFGNAESNSNSRRQKKGASEKMSKRAIRQVQKIAQNMNVVGTGLRGEPKRNGARWDDDFFPELLELKWPPEGRLIERDCTCDLWDRIRYRY